MLSKKSTKKISFILAASLLTAALPATTQAGWKKGMLYKVAGTACKYSAFCSTICLIGVCAGCILDNKQGLKGKNLRLGLLTGLGAIGFGAGAHYFFKKAKEEAKEMKETPSREKYERIETKDKVDKVFKDAFSLEKNNEQDKQ